MEEVEEKKDTCPLTRFDWGFWLLYGGCKFNPFHLAGVDIFEVDLFCLVSNFICVVIHLELTVCRYVAYNSRQGMK